MWTKEQKVELLNELKALMAFHEFGYPKTRELVNELKALMAFHEFGYPKTRELVNCLERPREWREKIRRQGVTYDDAMKLLDEWEKEASIKVFCVYCGWEGAESELVYECCPSCKKPKTIDTK